MPGSGELSPFGDADETNLVEFAPSPEVGELVIEDEITCDEFQATLDAIKAKQKIKDEAPFNLLAHIMGCPSCLKRLIVFGDTYLSDPAPDDPETGPVRH